MREIERDTREGRGKGEERGEKGRNRVKECKKMTTQQCIGGVTVGVVHLFNSAHLNADFSLLCNDIFPGSWKT